MSHNISNIRINNIQSSLSTQSNNFKRVCTGENNNLITNKANESTLKLKQRVQIPLIKPFIEPSNANLNQEQSDSDDEYVTCFALSTCLKERTTIKRNQQQQKKQVENQENEFPSYLLPHNYTQFNEDSSDNEDNSSYKIGEENLKLVGNKRSSMDCSLKSRPHLNVASLLRRKAQNKAVKKTVGRWSTEERKRFLQAVELFQDNWEMVEEFVNTRNSTQITNYAMKEFGTLKFSELPKSVPAQEEIQRLDKNSNLNKQQQPIANSLQINATSKTVQSKKSLDEQIQEFIEMIKQFETLYRIQSQTDANPEMLSQIRSQITILKNLLSNLIQANTTKKRDIKQAAQESRSTMWDIRERLNSVICEDLFGKLEVSSQQELNSKYSKLSDWIARPITQKCSIPEEFVSHKLIFGQPYSFFEDKLQQKLKSLDSSVFQLGQGQYNSLAATSTSLSQVSDDSQECLSDMGDMQMDHSIFENLCKRKFKNELDVSHQCL